MTVFGFVGFADSGKNTASGALIDAGYHPVAFADALKDCLCAIFGWNRDMIEGATPKSRAWREQVDEWWAKRLGIPHFTPRFAMQSFGTDTMRQHFHPDIWVSALERRMQLIRADRFVVTDVRHPNEVRMVRALGGKVYRVRRGAEPPWWNVAAEACLGSDTARESMCDVYGVHESEWAWVCEKLDGVIENDGTVDDLLQRVRRMIR